MQAMTEPTIANAGKANQMDKQKGKNWTIMVYFAGDNNLSEEMIYAIKEIYRVGVTPDFDVVVQFDPSAIGARVRRYVISQEQLAYDVEKHAELAPAIGEQKTMAASSLHAEFSHRRSTETARSHQRRTDITSLDEEGTIEKLGIPLPDERADAEAETRYQRQREELQSRGLSGDYTRVSRPHPRLNVENSADPEVLENFIRESMRDHHAKYYMVVLSGHGSGWVGDFLQDRNPNEPTKSLSSLSIPSLKRVLDHVQETTKEKVHILGMDSCMMSMAEIGYELRDSVKFVVGSEGFVPNTGWPYHRILETLKADSTIQPANLATTIVGKYIAYYRDYEAAGTSTDQSVCDLQQLKKVLEPKIKELAAALKDGLAERSIKEAIVLAHWEAQSYKDEQYTDLYDFCERLQLRCIKQPIAIEALRNARYEHIELLPEAEDLPTDVLETVLKMERDLPKPIDLTKKCEEVKKAIKDNVVKLSCYSGPLFQHSHGLSVFFPWFEEKAVLENEGMLDVYKELAFAKDEGTGWAAFLKKYLTTTRREQRNRKDHPNEKPVRIGPSVAASASVLVPSFSPVRTPNSCRGASVLAGSMKNPPDGFYREECKTKS